MMAPLLAAGLSGFVFGLLGGLVFITVESEKRLAAKALLDVDLETYAGAAQCRVTLGGELKPGQALQITLNGQPVLTDGRCFETCPVDDWPGVGWPVYDCGTQAGNESFPVDGNQTAEGGAK